MARRPLVAEPAGVVGLDLSLRRTAMVYLPPDWVPGTWDGVEFATAGYGVEGRDPAQCAERLHVVASAVAKFLAYCAGSSMCAEPRGNVAVFAEDYAFGLSGQSGMAIAELGGHVKGDVFGRFGIAVVPINQATARKAFLGRLPQGKGKAQAAVHDAVRALGPPWAVIGGKGTGSDEGDALVVANAGRAQLGMTFATLAQ